MNPSLYPTRAPRQCPSKYSRPKASTSDIQASTRSKSSQLSHYPNSLQDSDPILDQDNDFVAKIGTQSPLGSTNSGRKTTIGSESDSKSWSQDLEVRDSPNAFFWGNSELLFEKANGISINIEELKAFGSPQMRNLEPSELDEISIINEDEEFGETVEIVLTNDENLSEKGDISLEELVQEQEEQQEDYYVQEENNENLCQEIEQVIQSSAEEPFLLRGFSFIMGNSRIMNEQQDASLYNFNIQPSYMEDAIFSSKHDYEEDHEPKGFNFDDSDIDIDCDRVSKKIKTAWNSFK